MFSAIVPWAADVASVGATVRSSGSLRGPPALNVSASVALTVTAPGGTRWATGGLLPETPAEQDESQSEERAAQGRRLWAPPAGCFVVNNGRLLVVKHWDGKLDIPGGMANPGDGPPVKTAVRETLEEAGYMVTGGELLGVRPSPGGGRAGTDLVELLFLSKVLRRQL
jgi:8-oxo-dGTP pyrophosphatase MutT (NUDIX family)